VTHPCRRHQQSAQRRQHRFAVHTRDNLNRFKRPYLHRRWAPTSPDSVNVLRPPISVDAAEPRTQRTALIAMRARLDAQSQTSDSIRRGRTTLGRQSPTNSAPRRGGGGILRTRGPRKTRCETLRALQPTLPIILGPHLCQPWPSGSGLPARPRAYSSVLLPPTIAVTQGMLVTQRNIPSRLPKGPFVSFSHLNFATARTTDSFRPQQRNPAEVDYPAALR